jgi:hypothetical protein
MPTLTLKRSIVRFHNNYKLRDQFERAGFAVPAAADINKERPTTFMLPVDLPVSADVRMEIDGDNVTFTQEGGS